VSAGLQHGSVHKRLRSRVSRRINAKRTHTTVPQEAGCGDLARDEEGPGGLIALPDSLRDLSASSQPRHGTMFGVLPAAPVDTASYLSDYIALSQRIVVTPNNDTIYMSSLCSTRSGARLEVCADIFVNPPQVRFRAIGRRQTIRVGLRQWCHTPVRARGRWDEFPKGLGAGLQLGNRALGKSGHRCAQRMKGRSLWSS
jgi:hypothetical protein